MPKYLAVLTIALMLGLVLARVRLLKKRGIEAMHFGSIDKTDFLIPPFALFYFYVILAAAFDLPGAGAQRFFESDVAAWGGVALCTAGLLLLGSSLVSFGQSFRVGIDTAHPDKLITSGVFAFNRNPIYVAFALILLGQFLILPAWITLAYLGAGTWLFHRQVLREEAFMEKHYGEEFLRYRERVRRYI